MNNKEFISELSNRTGYNSKDTTLFVSTILKAMTQELQNGKTVVIQSFGTFEVKKKLERVVVNPATKQRMLVPPKMSVSFKVAPVLKDKANEK